MFKFNINLSLLKSKSASERGAALAELALSFPIALTIVLTTIHFSHVLRESNVVVEAARHGARSVAAASGTSPAPNPPWGDLPAWANSIYETPEPLPTCETFPTNTNSPIGIAIDAACGYLAEYFDIKWAEERSRWKIKAKIFQVTESTDTFWFTTVQVVATDDRGPVDTLRAFFGLRPDQSATFPLSRVE